VVVDNGSTDGSQQLESDFPRARFIRIPRNFGLTKALNLGVRGSEAEYVFFLHEDTEVFPDTTRLLAELLDSQPDAGAVCPLLVDAEGRPAPQLGKFPPDDTWRPASPGTDPVAVDYPRGAALMMRRHFFTAIRQIDERYGQFGSDADLCYQIRRAGKKILLLPQARARHQGRAAESACASPTASRAPPPGSANMAASGAVCGRRSPRFFGALGSLQLTVFKYLLAGQKVDGSQQE
jgi:GT2 family glycosyltransferase